MTEHSSPTKAPLLTDVLPALVLELQELLTKVGRPELVGQLAELRVVGRCRCGDDFCATIYTAPQSERSSGQGMTIDDLDPAEGMVLLDVVEGRIVTIEVLFRDEIREALLRVWP